MDTMAWHTGYSAYTAGLAPADCPYGLDRRADRIAWLDGWLYAHCERRRAIERRQDRGAQSGAKSPVMA